MIKEEIKKNINQKLKNLINIMNYIMIKAIQIYQIRI